MIPWRRSWQPQRSVVVTRQMQQRIALAFTEASMLDNAPLIVWTKGQMRGIRAALLRTKRCQQRTI